MATRQKTRSSALVQDAGTRPVKRRARHILIVAVPPVRALDVFGPAEVLGDANRLHGGDPAYEVHILSAGSDRVISSHVTTPVQTDQTYREYAGPIDTLLVAGGVGAREMRYERGFLDWLRERSGKSRRFGSICTGALVLAEAGLLNGRRATTHWNWCNDLRSYPRVIVDPAPIYVRDGNCYTSAGVTAGIDLTLALVEEDLGAGVALKVAQMMVVFLRRPGGQSQFSDTLTAQASESRPIADLLAWLPDHIRKDLSVDNLAKRVAMSPRNFARLFQQEVGTTPARHVEDLRLEAARRELESTALSLEEVASVCGFGSAEILRRLFGRRLNVTPGQYRASFGQARAR